MEQIEKVARTNTWRWLPGVGYFGRRGLQWEALKLGTGTPPLSSLSIERDGGGSAPKQHQNTTHQNNHKNAEKPRKRTKEKPTSTSPQQSINNDPAQAKFDAEAMP